MQGTDVPVTRLHVQRTQQKLGYDPMRLVVMKLLASTHGASLIEGENLIRWAECQVLCTCLFAMAHLAGGFSMISVAA